MQFISKTVEVRALEQDAEEHAESRFSQDN